MNDLIKIGDIVREIRKSKGKSQESFAELIDASVETVSLIERATVLLSTNTLVKIAESCNISTDYILGINHNTEDENT